MNEQGDSYFGGYTKGEPMRKAISLEENARMSLISEYCLCELIRASAKYPPMTSPHEGYAIVKEELDELWDEIKKKEPNKTRMEEEAVQLAAMAMRFVYDVCWHA